MSTRNDNYYDNFIERCNFCFNYNLESIVKLEESNNIEFLIIDWGSKEPLNQVIRIYDKGKNLVNFINHNQQLKHNYNHNNKYLFAIHGGWGITELDIALQNDRNISKLINIPIYNIYINADIQKKNKIYSFTDIINYHVKTILELRIISPLNIPEWT